MLPNSMTIIQYLLYILLWITHKAKKKKQICPLWDFMQCTVPQEHSSHTTDEV